MATTFQNDVLAVGNNYVDVHIQAYGDTDQAAIKVLDLGTHKFPDEYQGHTGVAGTDSFKLMEISWNIQGFEYVQLLWDAGTDDEIINMSGDGFMDFRPSGGKVDPKSATHVGDVLVTTAGADANSSYNILARFKKKSS